VHLWSDRVAGSGTHNAVAVPSGFGLVGTALAFELTQLAFAAADRPRAIGPERVRARVLPQHVPRSPARTHARTRTVCPTNPRRSLHYGRVGARSSRSRNSTASSSSTRASNTSMRRRASGCLRGLHTRALSRMRARSHTHSRSRAHTLAHTRTRIHTRTYARTHAAAHARAWAQVHAAARRAQRARVRLLLRRAAAADGPGTRAHARTQAGARAHATQARTHKQAPTHTHTHTRAIRLVCAARRRRCGAWT
jgi:hypothetical protein